MNLESMENKLNAKEEQVDFLENLEDIIISKKDELKKSIYNEINSYFKNKNYKVDFNDDPSLRINAEKGNIKIEVFTYASQDYKINIRINGMIEETIDIKSDVEKIENSFNLDEIGKRNELKKLNDNPEQLTVGYELKLDEYDFSRKGFRTNVKNINKELFESK